MDRLLERESELAAVEAALAGGGGVLCVIGGAELGKTSILDVASRQALALGWGVLRARGTVLETVFASSKFGL